MWTSILDLLDVHAHVFRIRLSELSIVLSLFRSFRIWINKALDILVEHLVKILFERLDFGLLLLLNFLLLLKLIQFLLDLPHLLRHLVNLVCGSRTNCH